MKKIIDKTTKLKSKILLPASKSLSHRAIIAASLSQSPSYIRNISLSDDVRATIDAVSSIGAITNIVVRGTKYDLKIQRFSSLPRGDYYYLNADNSGTTLRIMMPIVMTMFDECLFDGGSSLYSRPMDTYYEIFKEKNIACQTTGGNLPVEITGKLKSGYYKMRADKSSQFLSGMLYALPLLKSDSTIDIQSDINSMPYVNMTLKVLEKFGIKIEKNGDKIYHIKGTQSYIGTDYEIEDDYSAAANFLVAKKLGKNIDIDLVSDTDSLQGDSMITKILNGENIKDIYNVDDDKKKIHLSIAQIPDLIGAVCLYFSLLEGYSCEIRDIDRLKYKESDRRYTVVENLKKIGADIGIKDDKIIIKGKKTLSGGVDIDPSNDHRIAMMAGIVGLFCEEKITILDGNCVNKSYPKFWDNFEID